MKASSDLAVLNGSHAPASKLDRREMVRRLMLGAGAGFALPAAGAAHPVARHLADSAMMAEANGKAAAMNWTPTLLDPHQNETLTVLAERIIPGSSQAHVNRFIDLLVSVDSLAARREFLAALAAFEAQSLRHFSRPFKDLTEAQQNQMLTAASTEKPGTAEDEAGDQAPGEVTMRDHFENLKGWIAGAYYSSEVGMKELGWTGQVVFESFPGCQEPGGHQ
ncbi:MAG TPA: gluconate 2-dehydrogenase subunit 3 family protein [Terriglobia bacterium]|nr:gluconate 2-dehydrogenase subunit 3 family protein [Terriglobia bacterium]